MRCKGVYVALLWLASLGMSWAASIVHHDLQVQLDPSNHRVTVQDTIDVPQGAGGELVIVLHADLQITQVSDGAKIAKLNEQPFGSVNVARYGLTLPDGQRRVVVNYQGRIFQPVSEDGEEHSKNGHEDARSFNETAGVIGDEGVFLAHSSAWYPLLENQRTLSFRLQVSLPAQWKVVSQGARLQESTDAAGYHVVWQEMSAQEEIYLIAAKFNEYRKSAGAVEALAYLREADPALAQRYLDITAQYIEMYRQLIGPYPYSKFAVVENFWETGYGMPSFTLLGPKVIRLPFILYSSYPHEILHNWWGNGVYVDYQQGNWAEGLTSYLADHLLQEQQGKGDMARRAVLQNYTDFVKAQKEFPLREFTSRHSASSEAIGYGKAQMMFHMLRLQIGEAAFIKGLHRLYQQYKFKEAGYRDLAKIFSDASGQDLSGFFDQWVARTGSPELAIADAKVAQDGAQWQLDFTLQQTQSGAPYALHVPVAVTLAGQKAAQQSTIKMDSAQQSVSMVLQAKPLRIDVDPEFDLFRRLDRAEIPPALSQAFGAEKMRIVLPQNASAELMQAYKQLAEAWRQSQPAQIEVVTDAELTSLPADAATWLLGWHNRFADEFKAQMKGFVADAQGGVNVLGETFTEREHAVVMVGRHLANDQQAVVWLASANSDAVVGLARKLPHYRKYSYLAFSGDEPSNVAKGQWPVMQSPLSVVLDGQQAAQRGQLAARAALAQLPSVFDSEQMKQDVSALIQPEMAGRGLGSAGLAKAGDAIAKMFAQAGLQPGNPQDNSYFQSWTQSVDGLGAAVAMRNVIGVLPGSNPQYAGQSVIVSAHYDHLGLGWPDVKEGYKDQVHSGADDNASGVAVMMALARLAGKNWQPERSIVFIAFTGEEAGRLGSRYFVEHPTPYPLEKIIGVINLDTVGRLGSAPVSVFGVSSATEWVHIFRGIGFVTGISINSIANDIGSSDQKSFLDKGIPGVQLFGSVHEDFHTPRDTVDKLDWDGMGKMSLVLKEAVEYLIARPEPMTVTLEAVSGAKDNDQQQQPRQGRRVSIGTVPDFAFPGPGVLLSEVVKESPAQRAGLQKGDVLIKLNGQTLTDLATYAKVLRAMSPGDTAQLEYQRQGEHFTIKMTVVER